MRLKTEIPDHHSTLIASYLYESGLSKVVFAELCDVSPAQVSHWLYKRDRVAPDRALRIEKITQGKLKFRDFYQ